MRTTYHRSRHEISKKAQTKIVAPVLKKVFGTNLIIEAPPKLDMERYVDLIIVGRRVWGVSVKVRDWKYFAKYRDVVVPIRYGASGKDAELLTGLADWYVYAVIENLYNEKKWVPKEMFIAPMEEIRKIGGKEIYFAPKKMYMKSIPAERLSHRSAKSLLMGIGSLSMEEISQRFAF